VPIRFLLCCGLLLAPAAPALAQETCSSVTFERPQDRPLGACLSSAQTLCQSDAQCTAFTKDYCVHGVSAASSTIRCLSGESCLEDITFHFDKPYPCGRYVDGSWWVVADGGGRLTLSAITPTHTPGCESGIGECRHGWEIDQPHEQQSLSSPSAALTPRTPKLPHTITVSGEAPISVLKAIDNRFEGGCIRDANCQLFAAALTVLSAPPPANAFRPPFAGTAKGRTYTTDDLELSRLVRLPVAQAPSGRSFEDVANYFSGPFLGTNHRNNVQTKLMTLNQSYFGDSGSNAAVNGYHAARSFRTNDALLRLLLDDSDYVGNALHQLALYRAVQHGLDMSGVARDWSSGNRKRIKSMAVPIAFAAHLLADPAIATTGFPGFSEIDTLYHSPKAAPGESLALFGWAGCSEGEYWNRVFNSGDKWCGDPYGYTDQSWFFRDPDTDGSYQECCSTQPWKGGALLLRLLGIEQSGDMDLRPFLDYTDRWVERGYHTAPDPCATPPPNLTLGSCVPPNCSGYGQTWGPAPGNAADCHLTHSCECIHHPGDAASGGRLPTYHGTKVDAGAWRSGYTQRMWEAFRNATPEPPPEPEPGGQKPPPPHLLP